MINLISDLSSLIPDVYKKVIGLILIVLALYFILPYSKYLVPSNKSHINSSEPSISDKLRATKEYFHYSYRVAMYDGHNSLNSPVVRHRGRILGMDREGFMHVESSKNGKPIRFKGAIADVEITDPVLALTHIKMETSQKTVVIDTYILENVNYFVIWLPDGTPLNETLIANGLATPLDSPPTNIVNTLFKLHYKMVLAN